MTTNKRIRKKWMAAWMVFNWEWSDGTRCTYDDARQHWQEIREWRQRHRRRDEL